MIMVQMKILKTPAYNRNSIKSINKLCEKGYSKRTITELNRKGEEKLITAKNEESEVKRAIDHNGAGNTNKSTPIVTAKLPVPTLKNVLRRGEKRVLNLQRSRLQQIKVCFGWNVSNTQCEIDASAFLLTRFNNVIDDSWFVFYGQPSSPDGSVKLSVDGEMPDRVAIRVNLKKVTPDISKIVFVLTINEAFEHGLSFEMVHDTYVRLLDEQTNEEIVSYRLEENSSIVTSMTVAELYLHNGSWKINPIGNGIHDDLAGQCRKYGVEIE